MPDTERGDKLRDTYFRQQVKQIADASLADVKTRSDWEKMRPELHRQFLEMLGLWPLPPRTDLKATITGKLETENFTIEKLYFQSTPGLYVTANLYVPKNVKEPLPAIVYVCGHSNTKIDGVSYGSKTTYQKHPAWYAEHGYVCLIVDTLELGEIEGEHHGLYNKGMWWWQTLGYTPAGIECWNAMRALDYLETRKEVDPKRFGVAGRSGGGATSWWLMAADERVKCAVPVAGIADLQAHVVEGSKGRLEHGVIAGHCDCMYFTNTYCWDFDKVIALCAPRAVLLGNSDADDIFPVPGYRRIADKARRIYGLYDAPDHFDLMETKGPHKDTPELRLGEYRWMNRWLKNDKTDVTERYYPDLDAKKLKVFDKLPADAINQTVQETFIKPARIDLPEAPAVAREWWKGKAPELLAELKTKVFRAWPAKAPDLKVKPAEDVTHDGLRLRAYDFTSEEGVPLRVWLLTAAKVEMPKLVVLTAVNDASWQEWCDDLGPAFKTALQLSADPKLNAENFESTREVLEKNAWAYATIAPRGIGPTQWSEINAFDKKTEAPHIRRRFGLLGETLDGQRVWDVRRALACLRTVADLKDVPLWLQGKDDMAGIMLYAALFEPDVARLDLWHPSPSHQQGPYFLNVQRVLDMPQAVALALPRKIKLYVSDDAEAKAWDWPLQLQKELGQDGLQIRKLPTTRTAPAKPLSLHPDNPHYFHFRGKPTVLITSGEHYGAVLNRDFDYLPYLDELKARGFNLTRTFSGTYLEVPGSFKIVDNTLAPAPKSYLAPWARSDKPGADDGGNKFDLNKWDTAYFDRLKDFVKEAGKRGVVVEFVLFCTLYDDALWKVSPFRDGNNVNGVGTVGRKEVFALKEKELTAVQEALARKLVTELAEFDNVYFEVCNEPYFEGVTREWQDRIIDIIVDAEKGRPVPHLIAQNIANGSAKIEKPNPHVSVFNFHYATPPDAVAVNEKLGKPIGDDETGFRGTGDRVYRQEAWDFFLGGGSTFSHLDYSFSCKHPDGTAKITTSPGGGGPEFRKQLAILKTFLDGFELVKMKPADAVVRKQRVTPEPVPDGGKAPPAPTVRVLAETGKQYAVYVRGGVGAELTLELPEGSYRAEWLNPRTGKVETSEDFKHGGGERTLTAPAYTEDVALRIKRGEQKP